MCRISESETTNGTLYCSSRRRTIATMVDGVHALSDDEAIIINISAKGERARTTKAETISIVCGRGREFGLCIGWSFCDIYIYYERMIIDIVSCIYIYVIASI